jgi:glycosyltransferase involved in cell wall biosynthesis
MSTPFDISVIISTYDDRDLIPKKLAEIQAQTHFDQSEFIFIEPDSPGKERELLEPFCRQHANCRLIALDERINLYQAWNLGWSEAKAPFACISNMDDSMHPSLLRLVVEGMQSKNWDVATVLTAKQNLCDDLNDWSPSRLSKLKISKRPGAFFAWRRSINSKIGMFDDSLEIVGDKDFWARAEDHRLRLGLIKKIAYLSTHHPDQLSKAGEAKEKKRNERLLCAQKSYPHIWPKGIYSSMRRIGIIRAVPGMKRIHVLN